MTILDCERLKMFPRSAFTDMMADSSRPDVVKICDSSIMSSVIMETIWALMELEDLERVYQLLCAGESLVLLLEEPRRLLCKGPVIRCSRTVTIAEIRSDVICAPSLITHAMCRMANLAVADCRVLEGLPRYSSIPTYLPVNYQVLNADLSFFLKESNQDFMRNSSLMSRTEPFFIYQARSLPSLNASYGPLSLEQPVPLELLQSPGTFPASSIFTFNWKVQTFIMNNRIHLAKPKVQVLFYVSGRDWDDYSAINKLPCVHMFAFHETQEVRGTCQLKGELGLCVAELEPLASWFSPPSIVPGRQRNPEVFDGTPVELYYMLQSMEAGKCHSDEARKENLIRSSQEGLFGSYTSTPLRRIGGVRLYQNPTPPPLAEHRLDNNFMVMVPAIPMRQRETVSAFITVSAYSPVEMFTLRSVFVQRIYCTVSSIDCSLLCGPPRTKAKDIDAVILSKSEKPFYNVLFSANLLLRKSEVERGSDVSRGSSHQPHSVDSQPGCEERRPPCSDSPLPPEGVQLRSAKEKYLNKPIKRGPVGCRKVSKQYLEKESTVFSQKQIQSTRRQTEKKDLYSFYPRKGGHGSPRLQECIVAVRSEMGVQRVLQVDLKMESLPEPLGSRWMAWQVEYPASHASTQEAETEIRLAQEDLAGIVPLAMDSEILNTAVLTGKTVAVPVKVVTIGIDASVTDVSEAVKCRSTDEDVVKVSDRCDYVFVNGKEMKGKVKMTVNFTFGYLGAQLELNVWIPRLPLQIEVSDTELSQIKGWRVPIMASSQRSARDSEDEDDEDRRGRSCTLQYQHAMVRVLTHFVAESADPRGQTSFMLGTDWQVDITELVWDFLKVEDPEIAQLLDRRILVGLDMGMTTIQTGAYWCVTAHTVGSQQLVTGATLIVVPLICLSSPLTCSPYCSFTFLFTLFLPTEYRGEGHLSAMSPHAMCEDKQTSMHSKSSREALISAWLQFSDGSVAPLDLYNPDFFVLTATSLDEDVVTVQQDPSWKWPVIVTEAEGQGLLVRVEMTVCEMCQKFKRRSILAAGNCNIRVKFGYSDSSRGGSSDYGPDGEDVETRGRLSPSQDRTSLDTHYYGSSISNMEDGVLRRATTTRSAIIRRPNGDKLSDDGSQNIPIDFADFPAQVDLPRGRNMDDDLIQTARGLTDLEIGMYALLGVFCLAILVFLINCISYTLKYRHKALSIEGQENMNHAHDWVWLGNEAELLESQISLSPQQEEQTSMMESSSGLEEGSHLLNGGSAQKNVQGQVHRPADTGCIAKDSKGDSPTTKRKRVKFTTFTTIPSDNSYPTVNTLTGRHSQDIKWVCQDVEMGDSKELRNYMERLNDSALKEVA
ncbi:hypothetical protein PAMP_022313 [Pampus punctatissimus]